MVEFEIFWPLISFNIFVNLLNSIYLNSKERYLMKFVWNEDLRLKTDGDTARKIEVFTSERCEESNEFAAQE